MFRTLGGTLWERSSFERLGVVVNKSSNLEQKLLIKFGLPDFPWQNLPKLGNYTKQLKNNQINVH
jgi:hypothetical protein